MEIKKCKKCGRQIEGYPTFCQYCGEKVADNATENTDKLSYYKLTLPISILLAGIIFGGFYYATQINKQKSAERQEILKIEAEKRKEQEEKLARQNCYTEAQERATDLLKTKVSLGIKQYREAAEKDLFLKDDFNEAYEGCLSRNGLKK